MRVTYSDELTEKEKEIILLICEKGILNYKDISKKLVVSENTIRTHLTKNIYSKLNLHSIAELMYWYYRGEKI